MTRAFDSRLGTRKNLFVTCELRWGDSSASVRIRNISKVGVLIEGDDLPVVDTRVQLVRGQLSAEGQLVWVKNKRAGVEALEPLSPDDWLPLHSRVRKGETLTNSHPGSISMSAQGRDAIMAENLIRIIKLVEDVRVTASIAPDPSAEQKDAINKLDVIHRLLSWQVGELRP